MVGKNGFSVVKVLERVAPSKAEDELKGKIVCEFVSVLEKARVELGFVCEFFVGGSFGKGTYLKNDFDVDLFARFDLRYEDSELSLMLEKILKVSKLKFCVKKGSRNYYGVKWGRKGVVLDFEVIPCFKILKGSDAKNTTDFSPLHVGFLVERFRKNPGLRSEIRLAKQFFKAKGLYGAESYIGGFSGHVIDLLIVNFGSLERLLVCAKEFGELAFVDVNGFYKSVKEGLKGISKDKISNLVVVDSILPERNAGRAVCEDVYYRFVEVAREFKGFGAEDFKIEKKSLSGVMKNFKSFCAKSNLFYLGYVLSFEVGDESEDIVGTKLLKVFEKVRSFFEMYDFRVFESDFFIDMDEEKALFSFCLDGTSLPKVKVVEGPKLSLRREFLEKFKAVSAGGVFIRNGRYYRKELRRVWKIEQIMNFDKKKLEGLYSRDLSFVTGVKRV